MFLCTFSACIIPQTHENTFDLQNCYVNYEGKRSALYPPLLYNQIGKAGDCDAEER